MICLALLFLHGFLLMADGHIDVFMNKTETLRLLGIPEELYYVRDGIVNDYALSFNLRIKTGMTDIYFDWQAHPLSPTQSRPLYYTLTVVISNPMAMETPTINIPREGQVPAVKSVIEINLRCSGLVTAEVDIRILLNVTLFSVANVTCLEIRRKKMCLLGHPDAELLEKDLVPDGDSENTEEDVSSKQNISYLDGVGNSLTVGSSQIFYIGVGSTCGGILLITCLVLIYYMHMKRLNANEHLSYSTSTTAVSHDKIHMRAPDTSSRSTLSGAAHSYKRGGFVPFSTYDLSPAEVRANLKEIAVDKGCVLLTGIVTEGHFGCVYAGTLSNHCLPEAGGQMVSIKTVRDDASLDEEDHLLRDGCLTKGLRHLNINSILAVSLSASSRPLLIYPAVANEENLKSFLQQCNVTYPKLSRILNTQELVFIAMQIAVAIQYLHKRNITHRDIATRNCLIDPSLYVRVTDRSLSHDLFPLDYESIGNSQKLPVKWLSIEALAEQHFSPASDSWSFGVTLWELMTLAQQPYATVNSKHLTNCLKDGYRLGQPENCPNKLYGLMARCWSVCLDERPRFSQLLPNLQELYSSLREFV